MSVILPSRLSWALSDRPARSKGMWYGILGAFVAGIAVASVAGNIPKVAEDPAVIAEKAPVAAKATPVKTASSNEQGTKPNATTAGSKTASPRNVAEKAAQDAPAVQVAAPPTAPSQVASSTVAADEKPATEKPAVDQAVRVIGADRITPPPGAEALPARTLAPVSPAAVTLAAPAEPANTGSVAASSETVVVRSVPALTADRVPMPRNKPDPLIAAVPEAQEIQITSENAPSSQNTATPVISEDAQPSDTVSTALTGRVPMPRAKPAIEELEEEVEVAVREPQSRERAASSRLQDESRGRFRSDRRDYGRDDDRRASVYDRRPAAMSRRELQRIDRAEERAANLRAREMRRRNEDEGFELVRSYRGPDGRRVTVYRRMEAPRVVAYGPRPLFGRPAYLMPERGYWR